MRIIIFLLITFAMLWSGILGTTTSVLMQSVSLVVLSVSCFLTSIHAFYSKDKLFSGIALVPFIFTILCGIYFLTRALLSDAIDLGIGDAYLILSALLMYMLTCYWGRESLYSRLIIGAVMVLAVLNLLNFIPYFEALRDDLLPFAKGSSVSGLYNHRNFMSNFLMMAVLLFLSVLIGYRNNKLLKFLCLILAIAGIFVIYTAKARGGYIGLIAGIPVFCFFIYDYYLKNKKAGVFAKIGAVAIVLGVMGLVGKFGKDMYHERSNSENKATELGDRLDYFSQAIDQVPDAIWIGSGSMSYSYKCYQYWGDLGLYHFDHVWVHNEFLQALTDYGILGLLLIIGLILLHLWNALKNNLTSNSPNNSSSPRDQYYFLRVAGVCMIIGSSVDMMVSFPAHAFPNIMLMAVACAWMTFKNDEESSEPAVVHQSSAKYLPMLTLLVFGSVSLVIALPQLRAAMIFSQHGIYDESSNWSAEKSLDSKWLPALEQVVAVAPSHLRQERLSSLYLERAATQNDLKALDDIEKALVHSKKAIERHPYDAASIANHAYCLFKLKRYKEADHWYELLQRYTASRQKYFQSFIKRAHNLCFLAEEYISEGQIEEARSAYATAFDCCVKSSFSDDWYSRYVITYVLSSRTKFLMKNEFYSELDQMFLDFSGNIARVNILIKYPDQVFAIALTFVRYADLKFSKRKPEIALKWYIKSSQIINNSIPNENGVTKEMISTTKQYLSNMIQFLGEARITPAN